MTAKEMFEELGYVLYEDERGMTYQKFDACQRFDENNSFLYFSKFYQNYHSNVRISLKELKAINKQVEELGWLESEEQ